MNLARRYEVARDGGQKVLSKDRRTGQISSPCIELPSCRLEKSCDTLKNKLANKKLVNQPEKFDDRFSKYIRRN